ncbi:serine hydrolase domain-containing protein [Rhodophyticola sp. CCM32]|uniref:serine hydrolase domain-containing protein n=1 Tax=Rhodophyticola sp. CCM32 TaxID=2916397 RepID=UPI00143D126B|nr:serine hydrolase domain-containing protein [Rhodophyticola sp. CCM32]
MKTGLFGLMMGVVMTGTAWADDLQSLADGLVTHDLIPGAVVGLAEAERLDWAVAGLRIAGRDEPVATGDLWHLGSLTKSMTAMVAARLVERGLIGWDDSAGEVLGQDDLPGSAATLEMLLTHRSGIAANPGRWGMMTLPRNWTETDHHADRQTLVEEVLTWPLAETPGTYLYSNMGYVVAGQMLATRAGTSWEALIIAELFEPLGLDSAGFGPPGYAAPDTQPWGHRRGFGGRLRPADPATGPDNPPVFGPAGSVHMNAGDMLAYLRAHLLRDDRYLSAESWDRLHIPPEGADYAMGWLELEPGRLAHNGSNTFWLAMAWLDFEVGRALFVAANSGFLEQISPALTEAGLTAAALP